MYLSKISGRNQSLADKILNKNSDMMYAGIVSGNNVGEIWADDASNPAFCMVWSDYLEGFHFMESSCTHINMAKLRDFIESTILPFLKSKNINNFEFSCDIKEWVPIICGMLSDCKINKSKEYVYKLTGKDKPSTGTTPPAGYEVSDLTCDKVESMENYQEIKSDIIKTWGSMTKFKDLGKGVIATQGNSICGLALTRFLFENIYSIGVETYDPHKQKGLASYLSKVLFDQLISQNANIWWDCMESNIASQKIALNAGLTFDHEYDILWFDLNE